MSVLETATTAAIDLKGGMTTLTKIRLLTTQLNLIEQQLTEKIKQALNFFYKAPIVVELNDVNGGVLIDFTTLKQIFSKLDLVPIGVTYAKEELTDTIAAAGLAILRPMPTKIEKTDTKLNARQSTDSDKNKGSDNVLITVPVRSGQQVYAPNGDIIITASVSNGAELLAHGNIHVYGILRGRALAGINGNTNARIFCKSLEAELISIAGTYKISEDIEHSLRQRPVEVSLIDEQLQIFKLWFK